jgi:prepilin-type N-terminal cleavage/methylation domain-containing protein
MRDARHRTRGFTLLELLVSMGVGLVILGAALQLYSSCTKGAWMASERSEMQSDFRSAANLLQRDISMAGAGALGQQGIAAGSVGLASGAGSTAPIYPCNISPATCTYVNSSTQAYPGSPSAPLMYSIIPGYNLGITVNASEGPTDIITISYADANLALNCYGVVMVAANEAIFELPIAANLPATCVLPPGVTTPPLLNQTGIGLQAGDLILFNNQAVGVVTSITQVGALNGNYSTAFQVMFNSGDPGHINQPTITNGTLKQLGTTGGAVSATLQAVRLLQITYYLDISPIDNVTPRLMRIQSGRAPAPVVEGVSCLKFSYDVDNNGVITANQPSMPSGVTPNMITKVNILHMSIRSTLQGVNGYQSLDLQTSISARNLAMGQEYPINGSSY